MRVASSQYTYGSTTLLRSLDWRFRTRVSRVTSKHDHHCSDTAFTIFDTVQATERSRNRWHGVYLGYVWVVDLGVVICQHVDYGLDVWRAE